MNPRLSLLLALAACTTDEALSTTASEVKQSELEQDGFSCSWNDPHGGTRTCKKCFTVEVTTGAGTHAVEMCTSCQCPYDGGDCWSCSTYQQRETFATDFNLWFEAEDSTRDAYLQAITDGSASAGKAVAIN